MSSVSPAKPRTFNKQGGVLIGLTVLAAILRYWDIKSLPPGYWFDEAHKSLVALQILRGERFPVYITDYQGIEAGYSWVLAGWFQLFGASYLGTRQLAALMGTSTIPLTFWAMRNLYVAYPYRNRLGLISAGWLSVLLWHVHWSRLGQENITLPLFAIALLGAVAWAWQSQTRWAFIFAGAVLGLSQYTNPGARILPLEALTVFLLLARGTWRERFMRGVIFLVAALIVYAPLGWFFFNTPQWFLNRITFVSTSARAHGLLFILESLLKTLFSLNFQGDLMVRHNLSSRPALDLLASIWMALGLAAMWRGRDFGRAHLALLVALGVNLIPMVFSDGAPGFGRTLGATPMLVVLPALGVVAVWEWSQTRAWVRLIIIVSVLLSATANVYDYFVRYSQQPGLFDAYEVGLWTLTQSAAQASRNGTGYLILSDASLPHPATQLTKGLESGDLRFINGQECLAYPETTILPTVFSVMPEWEAEIRAQFPQALVTDVMHEPEPYQAGAILSVASGQHSATYGEPALATIGQTFELLSVMSPSTTYAPGSVVPLTLTWRNSAANHLNYTTFVHLVSAVNPYWAGSDGQPCNGSYPTRNWHPGEIIEYPMALSLPRDLPPGHYSLAVGMYDLATGERLSVTQANQREPDRAFSGLIQVK